MNPLVATLVAVAANLVAAVVAAWGPRAEARAATLAGAAITLGAAGLCAFPLLVHQTSVSWALGGLALRADAVTATLLVPFALAGAAIAFGLPNRKAPSRIFAATSATLGASVLALVADTVLLLAVCEIAALLAIGWGLGREGRAGRIYLGASGLLLMVGVGLALQHGEAGWRLSGMRSLGVDVAGVMLAASLVRLGTVPAQSGLTATLSGAPLGRSALLAAPLSGVLPLVRIVQPGLLPVGEADLLVLVLLGGALVAGIAAVTATDLGRAVGWTLAALHGLLVVGVLDPTEAGVLGGELLWAAFILSETGFVLAMVMVTRRLGPVDLRRMHGLQKAAPGLALGFLLVSLTLAGVPGTLEFVAEDVLLNGATRGGLFATLMTVAVIALVGFNALRTTFRVFYGPPDATAVDMDVRPRERLALLGLVAVVLAGGAAPGLLPLVAHAASVHP